MLVKHDYLLRVLLLRFNLRVRLRFGLRIVFLCLLRLPPLNVGIGRLKKGCLVIWFCARPSTDHSLSRFASTISQVIFGLLLKL